MRVVGTAGHVDHGKSTLVRALTGIDPDRLKEEKAREMTIDLGFAWLTLPDGDLIGIIDVPGHRDFIENMLAGVGGIDAVIFVIAADEGVMPQTREHLAIIDLLRIPTGIIALTKIDMVDDPDWIEMVQIDVGDVMKGTVLETAPVLPVSARMGTGLNELRSALVETLGTQPPARDVGLPRLWVDRVFSISGFGTVVTGTLLDGQLSIGQEIEFGPKGLRGRIRGLQSHQRSLETAQPGSRVAVNVSGIERRDIQRGYLLTLPDSVRPTTAAAVRFRHLPAASRPLIHNAEVKFFCGASETVARVRLFDADSLAPGEEGWLQLELRAPVPLVKGDRFILRYPSPGETIGGGEVIDPSLGRRWRRNQPEVIARLEVLSKGDPADLILQALEAANKPMEIGQIVEAVHLDDQLVRAALSEAMEVGTVLGVNGSGWIAAKVLTTLLGRLTTILTGFHKAEPLRQGMRPESLASQLKLTRAELDTLLDLAAERDIASRTRTGAIALRSHSVQWNRTQKVAIDGLVNAFAKAPYTPPSYKESAGIVTEPVLMALIEQGELVQVSPDVLFSPAAYREFMVEIRRQLDENARVSVKSVRDHFNTSRKYALALLEYLDSAGITRRDGDDHILASGDWAKLAL